MVKSFELSNATDDPVISAPVIDKSDKALLEPTAPLKVTLPLPAFNVNFDEASSVSLTYLVKVELFSGRSFHKPFDPVNCRPDSF
jgi:hypothetical protein